MAPAASWLFLLIRLATVAGHGILTARNGLEPRPGTNGGLAAGQTGIELQGAGNARGVAANSCGGPANQMGTGSGGNVGGGNPGNKPLVVKAPGEALVVQWEVTIAHDTGAEGGPPDTSGIRLALHYNRDDSFEQNIMRGCLDGDPGCDGDKDDDINDDGLPDITIPAYCSDGNTVPCAPTQGAGTTVTRIVNLPPGKVCAYCTVQWVWVLENRNTYYMGCADFAIQPPQNGGPPQLPNYDQGTYLDAQGNTVNLQESLAQAQSGELAEGLDSTGGDNLSKKGGGGGSSNAAAIACGLIFGLFLPLGLMFWAYQRHKAGKLNDDIQSIMNCTCCSGGDDEKGTPPPPGPTLQAGWTAAVDPNSGKPYYVNSANGQTTWEAPIAEPPAAPMAAKANVSAVGAALPPGWTAATDPGSGATYYVNASTGATQWEMPAMTGTRC